MPTIQEIKRSYGEEQARLLTYSFDIAAGAGAIQFEIDEAVGKQVDPRSLVDIQAAQGAVWGAEERQMTKDKYMELDLELRQAIEIRLEEIEEELRPKNATFADYAAAAAASEDALRAGLDMALQAGDEDAALVALSAARLRDVEMIIAHASTLNERWGDLFAELAEADTDNIDMDAGDKFELFAQKTPTAQDIKQGILSAPQSNANILGRMQ